VSIEVTKVWIENDKLFALQIPEAEIYKREWVGLTDEDWNEIGDMPDSFDQGVAWAAARLKRKNT
jgi:hypothetical protein